jgi:hypothetical protein
MFSMSPTLLIIGLLGLAVPATWVVTRTHALIQAQEAYQAGKAAARGEAQAQGAKAAQATSKALDDADKATSLPKGSVEIMALCRKEASCRERGTSK